MSIKKVDAFLWVEKYRPTTVEDCILPTKVKNEIKAALAQGEVSNMIFSGNAGVGKTSLAKAICNELDADMLYINMSNQTGIDVVRNQITQFASTASFGGNLKIIIGDECLSEHEEIRVGSVDSWQAIPLKELQRDTPYPVISFNMETQQFENDIAYIASDRTDELFEVTLDDGSTIIANKKHPFICVENSSGKIVERTIEDGFNGYSVVKMT